jgi:hypothetical protein
MYGGLFGDLPAAKKGGTSASSSAQGSNNKKEEGKVPSQNASDHENEKLEPKESSSTWVASQKRTKRNTDESSTIKTQQQQSSGSNSILQTVGRAGTSMAFVPTAALKRKKPTSNNQFAKPLEIPKDGSVPLSTRTSAEDVVKGERLVSHDQKTQIEKNACPAAALRSSSLQHEMTVTTTKVVRSTIKHPSQAPEVINIHGDVTTPDDTAKFSELHKHERHLYIRPHFQQHEDNDIENEEIADPYDPYFPNDLLKYWERQAAAEERARLEQETKEAMERQSILREELNRGREHGQRAGPAASGDRDGSTLTDSNSIMSGLGRGRGRGGVSNLPAWLVEKQRQEAEALAGLGSDAACADAFDDDNPSS